MENKQLSDKTIKTYTTLFNNFMKKLNKEYEYLINKSEEVIEFIKNNYDNIGSQKTIISAIIYFLKQDNNIENELKKKIIENYRLVISNNIKLINEINEKNGKNEKEDDNWMEWDEIKEIYNNIYTKYKLFLQKPNKLDIDTFYNIQNLVLLAFYVLLEPRRSEYVDIKIQNYDIENDNYYDEKNNLIILNNYKTSENKEPFIIKLNLNKELKKILKDFIKLRKINGFKSDYLFVSNTDTKIDNSQLSKRLNKIIGKNISVSMLRKIYLSQTYGDKLNTLKNIKKTSENMGNSIDIIIKNYIKK